MKLNIEFAVPAEDKKATLISSFLLFAIVAAFIILKSARDALFLGGFPARALPYFMGITTLATAAMATAYLRLYKILSLNRAVEMSLKAFSVGTLMLWAGVKTHWPPATPILYVWVGIFGSLAPVQAWSIIGQRLLTRQAKRAFGVIGAGGIAGASAGGFFAKFVSQTSSVSTLLPTATILILLALFACQALAAFRGGAEPTSRADQRVEVRPRFIALVLIVVGMGTIVTTFADFQFKVLAQRELKTAESLAPFFGSFYAYVGIITLIFQIAVTPSLMKRIGVASALAFLPFGLVVGNAWILVTGTLSAAILLKGSEQLFRFSIYRSSLEVLYMAIPDHAKVRLKSLIDTVGVRVSEVVGALLLVLLFSVGKLPLSLLAWLGLILLAISVGCTVLLGREYPKALKGAIRKKEVSFSDARATFLTTDFYQLLPEMLQTATGEKVLDLLNLLEGTSNQKLEPFLQPLLEHDDAEVRLKTLQLLFTQEEDLSQSIQKMVNDPDRRVRVEAIHYIAFRSSIDPLEKLSDLLTDPEPTIQAAACACSLNQEIALVQQMAFETLQWLLAESRDSTNSEVRLEVAHILEYVKPSPMSQALCRSLLSDPSLEVRKTTLRSITKTPPPDLVDALIDLSKDSAVRVELRSALANYGEAAVPELRKVLEKQGDSLEQKKLMLKVAADIGTPKAMEMLFACALGPNLGLRFIAIKALNRLRKWKSPKLPRQQVISLLNQELTALELEQERTQFAFPKSGSLLEAILNQRQMWALERIFRVLGLLHEPRGIYDAYLAVTGSDRHRMDKALEFLDSTLLPEHRYRLLKLIESQALKRKIFDRSTRKSMLFSFLGARDQLPAAAIVADFSDEEVQLWGSEIRQALQTFQNLFLVEETLNWRYSKMERLENSQSNLTTILKLEILSQINLFKQLGPQELLHLASHCEELQFAAGQTIFQEGESAGEIYGLVSGQVEMRRASRPVARVSSGDSFGALSVLGGQPRLFTAVALEQSYCLKIDGQTFWEILEDYPAISQALFKLFAERIKLLTEPTQL